MSLNRKNIFITAFRNDILTLGTQRNVQKYISIDFNIFNHWVSNHNIVYFCLFSPITVNEGGIKTASNLCPDPGEPENGKRIGSDFR